MDVAQHRRGRARTWLAAHNRERDAGARAGFYGLDLYSLHASVAAVLAYLDAVDREAAQRARYRYACFDHFGEDPQAYGHATAFGMTPSCERDVIAQLVELQRQRGAASAGALREPRLQRAIGVVYLPESERVSHYLHSRLPDQLDAIVHLDRTRAVEPLERTAAWERGEFPETYPTGF